MGKLIQVFEHDRLTAKSLCSKKQELGQPIIDKLLQYNDINNNVYFEGIRHGVKFKNYVGVIRIGNTTIEILPKADRMNTYDDSEKSKWHTVLLKMLAKCKKINVSAVSEASLKKRNYSLLDLYFELFLNETETLLKQGLIKKYTKVSGNVTALKGRLEFSSNIRHNVVRKERFFTIHQVYKQDHLINQILFKALKVLKTITADTFLIDRINRLLLNFPEMKEIVVTAAHFDQITIGRKNIAYAEALKIAKMILLNYAPDIKGGNENMLAILFDMNKLWEEYVYRMLSKESSQYSVSFQNREKFWVEKIIKPDIVLRNKTDATEILIIDTKWKIIDASHPDDGDLKQMYAYNTFWAAKKSLLLYPSSNPILTSFGKFHRGDNYCKLGFLNVADGKELDKNIAKNILTLFSKP